MTISMVIDSTLIYTAKAFGDSTSTTQNIYHNHEIRIDAWFFITS